MNYLPLPPSNYSSPLLMDDPGSTSVPQLQSMVLIIMLCLDNMYGINNGNPPMMPMSDPNVIPPSTLTVVPVNEEKEEEEGNHSETAMEDINQTSDTSNEKTIVLEEHKEKNELKKRKKSKK